LPWSRLCRPIITDPSLSDREQTESLFDEHHNAPLSTASTQSGRLSNSLERRRHGVDGINYGGELLSQK
jgi:hypothetical protein